MNVSTVYAAWVLGLTIVSGCADYGPARVTSAGGSAVLTVQHSLAGSGTAEIVYTATFN